MVTVTGGERVSVAVDTLGGAGSIEVMTMLVIVTGGAGVAIVGNGFA
jgi:hypothetical protein